jgi:hypothetical protein
MIGSRLARSTRRAGQSGCAGPIEATSTTSPGKERSRDADFRWPGLTPERPAPTVVESLQSRLQTRPLVTHCSAVLGSIPISPAKSSKDRSASRMAWRSRSLTTITSVVGTGTIAHPGRL